MSLPVSVPYAFANATTTQNLSSLDANFNALANGLNGLANGSSQISVSSISATGTANSTTFLRGDGSWANVATSGGGGGAAANVFYVSSNTLSQNYTLATGNNAITAGPLTIATGISLNVASGARLVVV